MRSPAQVSPAGLGGAAANLPGSAGNPASGSGPNFAENAGYGSAGFAGVVGLATLGGVLAGEAPPVAAVLKVAAAVDAIVQGFLDLFGGGGSPPKPYQERGGPHPAIDHITGIAQAWTLSEVSAASASPSNMPPLQRVDDGGGSQGVGSLLEVQYLIPYVGEGELDIPGEPSPPFGLLPRPVTYGRCLDAAEHPALWADLCRDMPNSAAKQECWSLLPRSAEMKRGLCGEFFET